MAWVYLFIAAIFEVVWAIALKYTDGFTRLLPTVVMIIGMVISFCFLASAVRTLPIGTAYAVWTGLGAVGVVIIGITFLGESINLYRLMFLALIIIGIIGLRYLEA